MDFLPAGLVHAPLLAGMHKISFADAWDAQAMVGILSMPGTEGVVAVDGGSLRPALAPPGPAGFVLWRIAAQEAEILTIAVLPPWRRNGLGAGLLGRAIADSAARGATEMFLEVAVDNGAALALYQKNGFVQVGLRKRYYQGKDAAVMRRDL